MSRLGMVIDLHKCTGCGACGISCKTENNTQDYTNGRYYNWANFYTYTLGKFPDTKVVTIPTLCNHCSDAPCVEVCPVNPKAMYKSPDGVTLHNDERCIGCQMCIVACPYSDKNVETAGVQYSVISFNPTDEYTHSFWRKKSELIPGCTSSGFEVSQKAGAIPPNMNEYSHPDYQPVRRNGVTEKCILCNHRTIKGELPHCVVSCPAEARTFGDFDDPNSEVSKLIAKYPPKRLKNNKGEFLNADENGTKPNVYYIREFNSAVVSVKDDFVKESTNKIEYIKVYPNPVDYYTNIQCIIPKDGKYTLVLFNSAGQVVQTLIKDEFIGIGTIDFRLTADKLPSGSYICVLKGSDIVESHNIIVNH